MGAITIVSGLIIYYSAFIKKNESEKQEGFDGKPERYSETLERYSEKLEKSGKTKMLHYYATSRTKYWFQIMFFCLMMSISLHLFFLVFSTYFFQNTFFISDIMFISSILIIALLMSYNYHRYYQK